MSFSDADNDSDGGSESLLEESKSLICEVSCSELDSACPFERKAIVEEVTAVVEENEDVRRELLSSDWCRDVAVSSCSSVHGYNRLVELIVVSISLSNVESTIKGLIVNLCEVLVHYATSPAAETTVPVLTTAVRGLTSLSKSGGINNTVITTLREICESSNVCYAPALSLLASLNGCDGGNTLSLFVSKTVTTSVFPEVGVISLLGPYTRNLTRDEFKESIAPSLLLKMKANPERCFPVFERLIGTFACNKRDRLVGEEELKKWVEACLRQLKSSKVAMRALSGKMLVHLASLSSVDGVAQGVMCKGWESQLLQSAQRQVVYEVMFALGRASDKNSDCVGVVLEGITSGLNKATDISTKEKGLDALLLWMNIGNGKGKGKGYDSAVKYLTKCVSSKLSQSDFRLHIGKLLCNDDLLRDTLLASLLKPHATALEKGLLAIIEQAIKKHKSASSTVSPQIDGLLAVHLLLLLNKVPESLTKLFTSPSSSFLVSPTMLSSASDPIISKSLSCSLALFCKHLAKKEDVGTLSSVFKDKVLEALSRCIISSRKALPHFKTIITYHPAAGPILLNKLLKQVESFSLECEAIVRGWNDSRANREEFHPFQDKDAKQPHLDLLTLHAAATEIISVNVNDATVAANALFVMHVGTTLRITGRQRNALVRRVLALWESQNKGIHSSLLLNETFWGEVQKEYKSDVMKKASQSFILTLGNIAGFYDADAEDEDDDDDERKEMEEADAADEGYKLAWSICTASLPPILISHLKSATSTVTSYSSTDLDLYRHPSNSLFESQAEAASSSQDEVRVSAQKRSGKSRKHKSFGGDSDEEWEAQMKKDKEAKAKEQKEAANKVLTPEQKKLLQSQCQQRQAMNEAFDVFKQSLTCVEALLRSDVIVGNEVLPHVTSLIMYIAMGCQSCPAFQQLPQLHELSLNCLFTLASCVYELEDEHIYHLPVAMRAVYRNTKLIDDMSNNDIVVTPSALPQPCPKGVPQLLYALSETSLSAQSFSFVFPLVQAVLTGNRPPFQRSELALDVITAHLDHMTPSLRRDVASALLEYTKHDRSQSTNVLSVLRELYECVEEVSSGELAPLLGEEGALGATRNRVSAMTVLKDLVSMHDLTKNPLLENRIWLNCHAEEAEIREPAESAWAALKDGDTHAPPSKMYAALLFPMMNQQDKSIATAASKAYAHGMALCPDTFEPNITKLVTSYIDNFPTENSPDGNNSGTNPVKSLVPPPPPKSKPKQPSALKKLKAKPKKPKGVASAAGLMGSGPPAATMRRAKKSNAASSAILKPKKQERTFDRNLLESQFTVKAKAASPEEDSPQKQSQRTGILRTLLCLADTQQAHFDNIHIESSQLQLTLQFLISYGLADPSPPVRTNASDTTRDLIATFGDDPECLSFLLPYLESTLDGNKPPQITNASINSKKIPKNVTANDHRKEGVTIALGSVALHLLNNDAQNQEYQTKIQDILKMLLLSLKTPSEDVQKSASLCLSKLIVKMKKRPEAQSIIQQMLDTNLDDCLRGGTLAARRGGAYGLSAVVKGVGISTLKKYNVLTQIDELLLSGTPSQKEGGLFAIELLSINLKLLFEPYVITLLPSLLNTFGDTNDYVRQAANQTTNVIMSQLSAHGVKLILPSVLTAFEDDSTTWRTKVASITMLGSMSHLAPKQLSNCLPKLVPKLTESFSDTHPRVKAAAQSALDSLCNVIRNPEIASITPTLLAALTDPGENTPRALETLIATEFLHAIDAPSLAVISPILHRGLRDRSAMTKRYAALITGNITTMVATPADFLPYLDTLLLDLKLVLLDPIPDVRTTASKAVGSLTRSLGEDKFPDLRAWLMQTMTSSKGSVERSGAAQGLSEMLIAGGQTVVEEVVLTELLPTLSEDSISYHREGVLWVLAFLPQGLGQGYASLITPTLPTLLKGLADDDEQVRDVALRAGRVLIKSHGKHHVDKILPTLENGMEHSPNVRIRLSSLVLLGDLLALIGNTKVTATDAVNTQEEIRNAERAQSQIALSLGKATRSRVLAGLYLARSDTAAVVRQNALMVWKSVVSITARTLKEIMPILVDKIVKGLGSGDVDQTEVAGRCLGDVVIKLGDVNTLPEIVPVLADELKKGDPDIKRGVCVGFTEILDSCSKESVMKYSSILMAVVREALCDNNASVRAVAPSCFQSLYNKMGYKALEEIVPKFLVRMDARALTGLTGILSVRSRELLPYLIPKLLHTPISEEYALALGSIAEVTASTIYSHFGTIIPVLINELATMDPQDTHRQEVIRDCFRSISRHVDEEGVNSLVSEIATKLVSDKVQIRVEGCWMFGVVVEERATKADFYPQIPIMYRDLLYRLNDDNAAVLKEANKTLALLAKHVPAEELVEHATFSRNLLASIVSDARRRKGGVGDGDFFLPGLNIPKGLEPLLPMFQRGILYGTPQMRETCARGLGELLAITAPKYLPAPLMIKITGPLLRIVGDRNPSHVKIAIVQTLGAILTKGGPALRAFVPQFQTTFVKSLYDPSRTVRLEAIKALGLLMPLSTRLDPLIKELVNQSSGKSAVGSMATGAAAVAVQTASLDALAMVLKKGGKKAKLPDTIQSAMDVAKDVLWHEDEGVREAASKVIGAAYDLIKDEEVRQSVVQDVILLSGDEDEDTEAHRHAKACACFTILFTCGKAYDDASSLQAMSQLIVRYMQDESIIVRRAACVASGSVLGIAGPLHISKMESTILAVANDTNEDIDVHRGLAKGLCAAVMLDPDIFRGKTGLAVMDVALKLAMSGVQKVQLAFNDFLWLSLRIGEDGDDDDDDGGESLVLQEYLELTNFENGRAMKSLVTKVLGRIKSIELDDM
eukprot:CAMPEP_0172505274 /NCGR_PEP_ID=MMETSP1066-20121228/185056_1 /TAXON_ID=671091 /ORGANISM="Coscinodiscus wailesii, Strain CCMP2513" /LENGTH=2828 /DNA_ID=CAMNT_0013281825 /DNA_START=96 /DNA_END=8582 /DNA_ORIENTATION=-